MPGGRFQELIGKTVIFCLFLFLDIWAVWAAEEIPEEEILELEKIIVSAKRFLEGLKGVAENVSVITDEEIRSLPARDLSEVLSYIPGVDIEPRSGFGQPTAISIQGSSSRHVRVMIDGIPLNTQASGQVNPTKFPIENIERIEIIRGAASSVWGSALGGVINMITKDAGDTPVPQGSITHSIAEYGTAKESFNLSGKIGELRYYLFASYMDSDGLRTKADTEEIKSFNKLSFSLGDLAKITSSFGYSQGDVNSGEFPDGSYQNTPYSNKYGRIGLDVNLDNGTIFDGAFKFSRQDIITKYFASAQDAEPYDTVRSQDQYYGLELKSLIHLRDEDRLLLGADFDWHILKSIYLTNSKSVNLQAPYANYTLRLNNWDWVFGARFDNNSEFGNQFSPSLGAVYHIPAASGTLIRATVSRAFNAPPLLWKFNDYLLRGFYHVIPNPDIKPERAWVYEMGIESKLTDDIRMELSLYRADVKDAIASVIEGANIYMDNFEKFRRQGAELKIKAKLNRQLSVAGSAAFNDVENRKTGKTVRSIGAARQRFDIEIKYKNEYGFSCTLKSYYHYWNQVADAKPNDRKFISDLRISQEIKNTRGFSLELFLNIYNLTNSKYWADYYFPIPRRYFEGGFTIKW